jgi:GINS complex subunit 3
MPAAFSEKMRRKLAVGAAVEDLRSRCPFFYDVAAELDRMIVDGGLARFVAGTFTLRYRVRASKARHGFGPSGEAI